jgi:membrane-associated protease RseP (regulator of RpoE activity)
MYACVELRNELPSNATIRNSSSLFLMLRHNFVLAWFSLGILIMFVGNIVTPPILIINLTRSLQNMIPQGAVESDGKGTIALLSSPTSAKLVSPVIPGMNFPWQHCVTFWIVTFVVVLVHEFGHACAAINERLHVEAYGFFLSFIFPGAYVRIEDSVSFLSAERQLRVYCAGVWHNVAFALLCMWISLVVSPIVLHAAYLTKSSGAVVVDVPSRSLLAGSLSTGDVIADVNGIPIRGVDSFTKTILNLNTRTVEEANAASALSKMLYQQASRAAAVLIKPETRTHDGSQNSFRMASTHLSDVNIGSGVCSAVGESDENIGLLDPPLCCKHYFTAANHSIATGSDTDSIGRMADKSRVDSHQSDFYNLGASAVAATAAVVTDKRCFVHTYAQHKGGGSSNFMEGSVNDELGAALYCLSPQDVYIAYPAAAAAAVGSGAVADTSSDFGYQKAHDEQSGRCSTDADCNPTAPGIPSMENNNRRVCVRPITSRSERILRIGLQGGGFVVFEGWPIQLLQPDTIVLGDYEIGSSSGGQHYGSTTSVRRKLLVQIADIPGNNNRDTGTTENNENERDASQPSAHVHVIEGEDPDPQVTSSRRNLMQRVGEDRRPASGLRGPPDRDIPAGSRKNQGIQYDELKLWLKQHPGLYSALLSTPGYLKFFVRLCIQVCVCMSVCSCMI